jgi:hypothetical protein
MGCVARKPAEVAQPWTADAIHAMPNPVVLIAFCVARLQVTRESSGDGNGVAAAPRIRIPPPRPKRKPTHPYP